MMIYVEHVSYHMFVELVCGILDRARDTDQSAPPLNSPTTIYPRQKYRIDVTLRNCA